MIGFRNLQGNFLRFSNHFKNNFSKKLKKIVPCQYAFFSKSAPFVNSVAGLTAGFSTSPNEDFKPSKYGGPSIAEIARKREMFHAPLMTYYKKAIMITEGYMQHVFDETGKKYLDFLGGIVTVSVGHCHPKVNAAVKAQLDKIWHTSNVYIHPNIAAYAEKLTSKFPPGYSVFFVNSGSEANELAMLLARVYTQNFNIIVLRNCYHGMTYQTMGAVGLNTWRFDVPAGFGVLHAKTPNPYRCDVAKENLADYFASDVDDLIKHSTPGSIAAFMAESIQGVGGVIVYPEGYLKKVHEIVKQHGGLFIADEVQTGFGRMGSHYWGYEIAGINPDIISLAKGIGNGFPMGAVVAKTDILNVLRQKFFFCTFGGNPVASAVGKAVLEVIDEEGLQANSALMGAYMKRKLMQLQENYNVMGDVRGQGLMIGIEFVRNKETKEPAPELTATVAELLKDKGVLVGKGGFYGNVLRISPPMCITKTDVDYFLDQIASIMIDLKL